MNSFYKRKKKCGRKREAKSQYSYLLAKCLLNSPFFVCPRFVIILQLNGTYRNWEKGFSVHTFFCIFKKDTLEMQRKILAYILKVFRTKKYDGDEKRAKSLLLSNFTLD